MRILGQVVRNAESLYTYTWPKYVTGINIDAAGVTNSKDNPKISFEYKEGYEAPVENNNQNKATNVRSCTTGGKIPPGKEVKRLRKNE